MIIENIKSSVTHEQFKGSPIDYVDIKWYEARKRIHKLTTRKGTEIGIRLDDDASVRGLVQGDVLAVKEGTAIVVNIEECDCIVVSNDDKKIMAKVCYEIGNRHSPLFYGDSDEQLIMPYDKPIYEMLVKLGVNPATKTMKIHNDRTISSAANDNGHHHHH